MGRIALHVPIYLKPELSALESGVCSPAGCGPYAEWVVFFRVHLLHGDALKFKLADLSNVLIL